MINLNIDKLNLSGNIVVGVSAGPDSMALFHYIINNYDNKKIICAHINHNVRKQSEEEETFLKDYCNKYNIIFECFKINNYTENNFENEARKKRYCFYENMLKKYNSKYLLLAHHADDLMETILMKICRGSNLIGYAGIKKISKNNNYYIIRPLLEYTKDDIRKYLKENNIKSYEDCSNNDLNYTRNRFRHKIIPLLKEEDINIHKKFIKYSNTILECNDYINYETRNYLKDIYLNNILDLEKFNKLHDFIKKNILYTILNDIYNNKTNIIKDNHVINILSIINNKKPNLSIKLPHNLIITKEYNNLIFISQNNISNYNYKIKLTEDIIKDNFSIKFIDNSMDDGNDICRLNSYDIKLPLYIRNRNNGDFIEVLGLKGKKKIKDIFIEKKIPVYKRNLYPILVDSNNNILWIPNIKKSKFNKKKDEKYDIILKYCELERRM